MAGNKKDVCVIGAGRFGQAVVEQLIQLKRHVLAIDTDESMLQKLPRTTKTVVSDAANIEALKALGLWKFNSVIVGATDNIEIIAALIQIGVENIIAKASTVRHERVLRSIGVDVIIKPEAEAGLRAALISSNPNFIKYSENLQDIGDGYAIGSTQVTNKSWINRPLRDLKFAKLGVSVVSSKSKNKVSIPAGDFVIKKDDQVTLIGKVANITKAFGELNLDSKTQEIQIKLAKKMMRD